MKKLLLVTLATFLASCSTFQFPSTSKTETESTSQISRKQFIGNWQCEMDGGKIGTSNKVKLSEDGHASYLGLITMPKEDPLFQYKVKRQGTWSFADNTLFYIFTQSSVERAHTSEMLRKIKTSKELNATENEYFAAVKSQMTKADQKPISLAVSDFTTQSFTIKQTVAETARTGRCVRAASY